MKSKKKSAPKKAAMPGMKGHEKMEKAMRKKRMGKKKC